MRTRAVPLQPWTDEEAEFLRAAVEAVKAEAGRVVWAKVRASQGHPLHAGPSPAPCSCFQRILPAFNVGELHVSMHEW